MRIVIIEDQSHQQISRRNIILLSKKDIFSTGFVI